MTLILSTDAHSIEVPEGATTSTVGEKLILPKDILQSFPLGTKRKLENIKSAADYNDPASAANGDIADMLLAIISSGNPINVLSGSFTNLMNWMISQSLITQADVEELKGL